MNKKSLLMSFILCFCIILTACANKASLYSFINDDDIVVENNDNQEEIALLADITITVRDMANYLETRKAHYPISDEFIEKYQQTDGGYIDNALKAGLLVDKQKHEPNQKWHFFDSWLYPTAEENESFWNESAKSRVYSKLLCPELLLWIYEACQVSPSKVRAAYKVAEASKVNGTHISTMAKQMRECVPWEDLEKTLLDNMDTEYDSYSVTISQGEGYSVSNLSSEYIEGKEVKFTINVTDTTKVIDTVTANGKVVSVYSGTTYKFTMPSEAVSIVVTLKDKPEDIVIPTPPSDAEVSYNIRYTLPGKTAKLLENAEDIYNTFTFDGQGSSIINSVSQFEYIYGGGRGGSGDNIWYAGDMLKFGTNQVNGSLTLSLSAYVSGIKITGYTTDKSCSVQVGDSLSNDWTVSGSDNKTSVVTLSDMVVTSKAVVDAKQATSKTITFASTNSVKIAVTNKKPFYITSIEFILSNVE